MLEHHNELLGPAEIHIITELNNAIEDCKKNAEQFLKDLDDVDTDNLDELMLDPERKDMIIGFVRPVQQLAQNLQHAELMPVLMAAMLRKQ